MNKIYHIRASAFTRLAAIAPGPRVGVRCEENPDENRRRFKGKIVIPGRPAGRARAPE